MNHEKINYYAIPGILEIKKPTLKQFSEDIRNVVIGIVCGYYGIPVSKLMRKDKVREIVEARQICMYLLAMYTSQTLRSIGEYFGSRDHSTVGHARERIKKLMKNESDLRYAVNHLKNQCGF